VEKTGSGMCDLMARDIDADVFGRYSNADGVCQEIYQEYEKQQRRLGQIRVEINALNASPRFN
jgi:hypothetical protein